uniref:Uncharacterized protein MANES_03G129600 n=1 Tax=Rhizophora mucronata TaxID=61149 RepID=A0A2P2Q9Y8_RHIMU
MDQKPWESGILDQPCTSCLLKLSRPQRVLFSLFLLLHSLNKRHALEFLIFFFKGTITVITIINGTQS